MIKRLHVSYNQVIVDLSEGCIWGLLFLLRFEGEYFVNLSEGWSRMYIL